MSQTQESTKTIVLDRDGVINKDSPNYIKSHKEWIPIPGSLEAISSLHQAGFYVLIATNQSGLARGLFDEFELAKIHHKLCSMVEEEGGFVSGIFYCPHSADDECECRKPNTGMLIQAENELGVSLDGSPFVGDSLKDLEAATAHGMRPILVRTGNGSATEQQIDGTNLSHVSIYDDLQQAVVDILAEES